MAKYYSGIDTSVGVGTETLNGMLANGSDFGVLPSKDIDCANINASGIHTVGGFFYPNGGIKDSSNSTGTSGKVLSSTGSGLAWIDPSEGSTANAVNVGTNLNSTNADQFVAFMGASSGNNPVRVDTDLKYNPSTGTLSATTFSGGGAVTINNNGDNRIITGSATAGELNGESSITYDGNKLNLSDDKKITFGSNLRMEIYTDGSTNYIKTPTDGSGAFPISIHSGSSEVINIDDGNTQIKTGLKDKDGDLGTAGQILSSTGTQVNWISVGDLAAGSASQIAVTGVSDQTLTYVVLTGNNTGNQSPRSNTNLTFNSTNGTLSATSFSGSGANLTNLPAANITGTLPAISGANLTNLDASDLASGTIPDARLASSSLFVTGMILLWSGAASAIPTGWVLCDGNNSTPDLRDKFVVGASNSTGDTTYPGLSPNATGGAATDTVNISDSASVVFGANGTGTASRAGSSSATVSISDSDTVNTLPPYYALCYIMKT